MKVALLLVFAPNYCATFKSGHQIIAPLLCVLPSPSTVVLNMTGPLLILDLTEQRSSLRESQCRM